MLFINLHDFIAGWVGGVAGIVVGHPGDTVKVRQQTYSTTLWVAIKQTYIHEGFVGFYKGMLFPILGAGPANSVLFGVYGNCMQYLQNTKETKINHNDPNWMEQVFYAGCAGGLAVVLVTCPGELVKVVLQSNTEGKGDWKKEVVVRETGMWSTTKNIYKRDGIQGLYRGLVPMLYRDVPAYGLYVLAYEYLMEKSSHPIFCSETSKQIVSGGIAGILSWIFVMPFDLVKSRIQADNPDNPIYKGMMDCFYKSYKADGISIFNTGILITIMRAFPVNAAIFVGYEVTLKLLREYF